MQTTTTFSRWRSGFSSAFFTGKQGLRRTAAALCAALFIAGCGESELDLFGFNPSSSTTTDAGTFVGGKKCTENLCGIRGTCDDSSGEAICTCDQGYTGTKCLYCATGYKENEDGDCVPNGSSWESEDAGTSYNPGTADAGPTVKTCASLGLNCGANGTCLDNDGSPFCECKAGWSGNNCQRCAAGYTPSGNQCLATCAVANLNCGKNGSCDDSSGTAACACKAGYAGSSCDHCANGYQDKDGDGVCKPNCSTASLSCGSHGSCSDSSGTAVCTCNTGYAGTNCSSCDSGYQDRDGDGLCKPNCRTANLNCGSHGSCSDSTGTAQCSCNTGYAGTSCTSCASGYQDKDGDGVCKPTCSTAGLTCGGHGSCSDSTGTAQCSCNTGYSGTNCTSCASGYQDKDGDGVCKPTCATAGLSCSSTQVCSDSSGTAVCVNNTPAPTDEWTFMVFLNGDNNLSSSASNDLSEMEKGLKSAGSSAKVNVIVLSDNSGSSDTKLYKVTNTGKTTLSSGTNIFSGSEADMSSAETLKKFGVWAVKNYPAKKYALIMWDHGSGWRGEDDDLTACRCGRSFGITSAFQGEPVSKGFSSDDTTGGGDMITLADGDYGNALNAIKNQAGKKLSVIGFDACLMGMYEVAAASVSYGDYLVASSEIEPGSGWDYEAILKLLGKTPTTDALTLSKKVVDSYYAGFSGNATMAVYDLSKFSALKTAVDNFGNALKSAESTSSYKSVIKSVRDDSSLQAYDYKEHVDFRHFISLLKKKSSSLPSDLISKATSADTAASNMIVYFKKQNNVSYHGYGHDNATGMAIFFPASFNCTGWVIGSGSNKYTCSSSDPCSPDPCSSDNSRTNWYRKSEVNGSYKNTNWSTGWTNFLNGYY